MTRFSPQVGVILTWTFTLIAVIIAIKHGKQKGFWIGVGAMLLFGLVITTGATPKDFNDEEELTPEEKLAIQFP